MKPLITFLMLQLFAISSLAQQKVPQNFPLSVTIFSESIGIPDFKNFFKHPGLGVRIGTEFYYANKSGHQTVQTVNLGYYHHKDFQNGLYISSEVGYRKFIGQAFIDGTLGLGYLLVHSAMPRYTKNGDSFERIGNTFGRLMPTVGLGAGYRFNSVMVFSRYEMFGEMPFGFKGLPALPHKTFHVGTRFNLK